MIGTPAPDIVGAVVAYLQGVMGGSLASATGYPQVYSDYAPEMNPDASPTVMPYAVVTEGPETYSAQSESIATGYYLSNIADGTLTVAFYATTKVQARSLGKDAVRKLTDSQESLVALDGAVVTILPVSAASAVLGESGIGTPSAFLRIVTFNYKQQFLE